MMTGLVVVISLSALYWVQNELQQNYDAYLSKIFVQKFKQFEQEETQRLQAVADAVEDATRNPRIFAALEEGDNERFYTDMGYELIRLMQRYKKDVYHERVFRPFFRFFPFDGPMFEPSESNNPGYIGGVSEAYLAERLEGLAKESLDEVAGGYLTLSKDSRSVLYQIIIAPVFDQFDQDYWGNLVFAVPVLEKHKESLFTSSASAKHALLTEGLMSSDSLKNEALQRVKARVVERSQNNGGDCGLIEIEGVTYRVYAEPLSTQVAFPTAYQISLLSLADLLDLQANLRNALLLFAVIACGLALLLSFIIAHRLSRPIVRLVEATQEVKAGNLETRVPVVSRDEIGRLSQSFNEMTADLVLKNKYHNVLNRIADRRVADALMSGKIELGGETQKVTVLFCDIRGFTELTDGMDPQRVVSLVNEHMTAMTHIAQDYCGIVDKFVGDEIMILFGPLSVEERNDCCDAVHCALAMVKERTRLNASADEAMHIGIGIATGAVVAGYMGAEDRLSYTVLGDRVNLAARLCSIAEKGEIILDAATETALEGSCAVEPLETVSLKGFNEKIKIYRALHSNK